MEGEMGREVAVWWGPDSILSALGFGTRENMEAVRAGRTNLSVWHDGTPVCRIDPERFAQLTAERAVAEYTPAERLALLTLGEVIADRACRRERTDAHPALHDQRQHRPAER